MRYERKCLRCGKKVSTDDKSEWFCETCRRRNRQERFSCYEVMANRVTLSVIFPDEDWRTLI